MQSTLARWLDTPRVAMLPSPAAQPAPKLSFEFFPPKSEKLEADLWACIRRLAPLGPRFVSVTYGAGGSTRARTHDTVARLARETSLTPAAHLTCVGGTREEVDEVARAYWQAGVRHIVALRGDPPAGSARYEPHPGGYAQAEDMVRGLRRVGDFDISVGAYPEGHPVALSAEADLDFLKRKIDAGATRAITQYCFDTDTILRFLDRCHAAGIRAPIVPGIMPIANFTSLSRFSAMCGASVPAWLARMFEGLENDPETHQLVAATVAAEQVRVLRANGVDEFHLYTLNRPELSLAVARILGVRPQQEGKGA
ncbi:methylenetetrahydrofolate reductase [NAD(P)H] [Rhodovarius crocodyli]|uniref:Methylenetetrahydrofolate reductase n=1 Tax=Rhodovarius crocodyli TaxID=1979269 RepID=A0A437MDW6_9PROT|nr:methylenetetrahydrofolate reductase [NAD(P)H] [Rhodovarius crocodyli]RVT95835.1 methylenetetrahydrofolate reductase [NAD(P)H] [Rhodovarius crocodyli]